MLQLIEAFAVQTHGVGGVVHVSLLLHDEAGRKDRRDNLLFVHLIDLSNLRAPSRVRSAWDAIDFVDLMLPSMTSIRLLYWLYRYLLNSRYTDVRRGGLSALN